MSNDDLTSAQATTDQIVDNMIESLRADSQTDIALLEILSENIVKLAPAETAVDNAVNAIETLATERAKESSNGPTDNG